MAGQNSMAEQLTGELQVEVAYAKADTQKIIALTVPEGTSLYETAERSRIVDLFPEIDLATIKMGVFGKLEPNPRERLIKNGERVELYRPLIADPKEVRKRRAEQAKRAREAGQL